MKNTIRAAVVAASLRAREVVAWAVAAVALISVAWAAQTNYLGTVFLADSTVPSRQATISASGELSVNCTTGCAGGSASNASDNVATSSDNGKTNAWLYGYDGTNWDRLQVDASGFLKVNIAAGAAAGGTSSTDDAAFTAATGSGTPMMGFVTADSVDSGDVGVVGMLANRQLKVTLYDSSGVELSVGGGTQYTEDAAAAANPVGNAIIAIRDDALGGSLTTTDGDNVALRANNKGELYVKHTDALTVNSHAVTNAGTFAVQDSQAITDDAAFTPATSKVFMAGAEFDDTTPDSVNEGDAGAVRMSANRSLYVNIRDNAGNERGLNIDASGQLAATVTNATAANLKAEVTGAVTPADAAALGTTSIRTYSLGGLYNGTTVDMWREAVNSLNSTGTGLATAAQIGQCDDTTPTALTENQFGNVRIDCTDHTQVGGGLVTTAAPSYSNGTARGLSLTTAGLLRVSLADTAANSNALVVSDTNNQLVADDAAFTIATSKVNTMGALLDDVSTDAINEGDTGAVRANTDRILMVQIAPAPSTSPATPQGVSTSTTGPYAATTNETEAKASAGVVYGFTAFNNSATVAYLTFYNNTAAGTTCGTSEISTHLIPASTSGAGVVVMFPVPVAHATGITYCITTGIDGTGAVSANTGVANVYYR